MPPKWVQSVPGGVQAWRGGRESLLNAAVLAETGEVPGTAGQGVVLGQGVGCGWKELEEGRVGGQGRRVKVGQAREGAGPAGGGTKSEGLDFLLQAMERQGRADEGF